ncbi:MAG: hypothetical protein R3F62_17230 [Planctomycetota bacterium]
MSTTCCDETAAALREGRRPAVGDCPTCAALVAAHAPAPAFDAAGGLAQLELALAAEEGWRGRARSLPTWARVGLVVGAVLAVGALNALVMPRPDLGSYPTLRLLGIVGAFVAGAWAASVGASWPLQRAPLPLSTRVGLALLGVALPLAATLLPEAPATADACCPPPGMFGQKAFGCLIFGCLFAAPALLALALVARTRLTTIEGLLLAGVGALTGQVALTLHCPIVDETHQLVGHVPVGVLLGGAVCGALALLELRPR